MLQVCLPLILHRFIPIVADRCLCFLHKFSVTQLGAEHLVKWTTEQESDIDYYELQRSTNGIDFSAINRQPAGNTIGPNHYSYSDNSFSPGINYYRLKIVERDGYDQIFNDHQNGNTSRRRSCLK